MLGISERSIYNLAGEENDRLDPGDNEDRDRGMAMSSDDLAKIRPAIIALVVLEQPRRLDTILAKIKETSPDWKWSRETLRKAMASIGITYKKRKEWYYLRLSEDEANCLRRAQYLRYFFMYEEENRNFEFFDESWCNKNMVEPREWSDGSVEFDIGVPPGVGDRWIMMGCGSKKHGWQRSTFKMWKGTSKDEDYHGNMDAQLFKKWVMEYMEVAEDRSVLVIDRAPYHMGITKETRRAVTSMNKEALAIWLLSHDAKDENDCLYTRARLLVTPSKSPTGRNTKGFAKTTLYALCRERDPKPKFEVLEWFKAFNSQNPGKDLKVLILPVATPQLNPIEPFRGQMKQHIRKYNTTFTMSGVKELAMEKYKLQTPNDWKKQYDKMIEFAKESWKADELLLEEEGAADEAQGWGDEKEEEEDDN
jgi:hypothetical protein